MIGPCFNTDKILKIGFKINLESHSIIRANSILSIVSIYPDSGIDTSYNNKFPLEMATIYTRLINQYMFLLY